MLRSLVSATDNCQCTAASKLCRLAWGTTVLAVGIVAVVAHPCLAAATPSSNASSEPIKRLPSREVNGDLVTVRGQVLTPDGRPAAGATVGVFGPRFLLDVPKVPLATTKSGSDGTFEITYSRLPFASNLGGRWRLATIAATLPGFGFQWTCWTYIDPAKPPVLKLVRDVPIRGRVLNLEGKPLVGVRVRVVSVNKEWEQDLDAALAAIKADSRRADFWNFANFVSGYPTDWNPHSTTDADGRFTLTGLGADRIVNLDFQGDEMAYAEAVVATRPVVPDLLNFGYYDVPLRGAEFTLKVSPAQTVVGTIRDAATGEPLPGVGVRSQWVAGSSLTNDQTRAETDVKGHYELRGMQQAKGNEILIRPNDDQPYLMREFEVLPHGTDFRRATIDVDLHRGVWIRGRVTNKVTGQPVVGAVVRYAPLATNPFTLHLPEFDRKNGRQHMEGDAYRRYHTDAQGNFKLVALPGPGLIGVYAFQQNYLKGIGDAQIPVRLKFGGYDTYHPPRFSPRGENAIKEINPPADARMVWCDFALVPGESVRLTVVDPDGRPAPGCFGLNIHDGEVNGRDPVMDSTAEVDALERGETRRVWILQRERMLGKCFELKAGNRPGELTVKLEPCARLTGRLVDPSGKPLERIQISVLPLLNGPSQFNSNSNSYAASGSDGRFVFPYVPVGCEYSVSFEKRMGPGRGSRDMDIVRPGQKTSRSIEGIQVEAGKAVDFGEIVLQLPEMNVRRRR